VIYTPWSIHFQLGNNKIKLLMEYESVTQKVLSPVESILQNAKHLQHSRPSYSVSNSTFFLLMFASCWVCITNNGMSFVPSTQHFFNSHYMFRPQRVIFRCYKHMVFKLHHKSLTCSSLASNSKGKWSQNKLWFRNLASTVKLMWTQKPCEIYSKSTP
jgi:hypothetical protein